MARKITFEEAIDSIKKQVNEMTDEQLKEWGKSKECFDYLNR